MRPPEDQSFRVLRWVRNIRDVEIALHGGFFRSARGEGAHWHYHAAMELTLFTGGEGTRFVGDHIAPFHTGDMVLLGPRLPHYWHVRGASGGISVQWHFPPGHPFWTFPEVKGLETLFTTAERGLHVRMEDRPFVRRHVEAMLGVSPAARLGLLIQTLAHLAQTGGGELLSRASFALPPVSMHQQAMSEAVRYILANYRESLRLPDLLRRINMSKATFARQFKRHAGKTFTDFVLELRLQHACEELQRDDRTILNIAVDSGFSQISFFNRAFRRVYNTSPDLFRKEHRRLIPPFNSGTAVTPGHLQKSTAPS